MTRSRTKYVVCLLKRGARKPIECWTEDIWGSHGIGGQYRSPEDVAIECADEAHRRGEKVFGKTLTVSGAGGTARFAIESFHGAVSVRRIR